MNIRPTYLDNQFRHAFRNLAMPDRTVGLDPEKWVKYVKRIGATVAFMDFQTAWYSNYNSEFMPKDPVLGKRDLGREFVDACEKHKINACAYIRPCNMETMQGNEDWQQRTADGLKEARNWGSLHTVFCYNTGYGEFYANYLAEIARKYKVKGYFIDGAIFGFSACYCETCKQKFRQDLGRELPTKPDWGTQAWYEYLQWRYKQVAGIGRLIGEAIHNVDPRIAVVWNCSYPVTGWYAGTTPEQASYMDLPCVERPPTAQWASYPGHTYAEELAWDMTVNRGLRFGQWTQHYSYFTPPIPKAEIMLTANMECAFGSAGCPQEHSRHTGQYYDNIKQAEPWMIDSVSANDVAVHYSLLAQNGYYRPDGHGQIDKALADVRAVFRTLLNAQLPADVITDEWLEAEPISQFKTIVLPNSVCLTPKATAALQAFVQGGGTLIATMETGLRDHLGNRATDELLWKGSGLKCLKEIEKMPAIDAVWSDDGTFEVQREVSADRDQYLMFNKLVTMKAWIGQDITLPNRFDGFERREITQFHDIPSVHVSASALAVQADKSQWKTLLEMRYRENQADGFQSTPSVLTRKVGKGRIVYVNFQLGEQAACHNAMGGGVQNHLWWRHFTRHLVEISSARPRVDIQAPICIKSALWHQPAKKRYALHLVNELSTNAGSNAQQREDHVPVPAKVTITKPGIKKVKVVIGGKTPGAKPATVKKVGKTFVVTLPAVLERAVIEMSC